MTIYDKLIVFGVIFGIVLSASLTTVLNNSLFPNQQELNSICSPGIYITTFSTKESTFVLCKKSVESEDILLKELK